MRITTVEAFWLGFGILCFIIAMAVFLPFTRTTVGNGIKDAPTVPSAIIINSEVPQHLLSDKLAA